MTDTDKSYPRSLLERRADLPPVHFIGILARHVGMDPIRYDYHPNTESPHLFTFHTEGLVPVPRPERPSQPKHMRKSFSINMADLRILMDEHKLMRIQSNAYGEITLYFGE